MWRRTRSTTSTDPQHDPTRRDLRVARWLVAGATLLFLVVVTGWHPWRLFDRAGFSNDFYDEQARAFLHGRLDVDPAVPGPEGFLVDGSTYLYYGPFLAIVRLPFAAFDLAFGHVFVGRLVRISMVAGFATLLTASWHLARLAGRHAPAARRVWWRSPLFVAAVVASPALFLAGWISVYHETEMWAAAFAMWAGVGALRWRTEPLARHARLAGLAAAAAFLTRASVGLGSLVGIGLVALLANLREADGSRRAWSWTTRPRTWRGAAMVGWAALGALGHFALNTAKFGSPTALPGGTQLLSLQNPARAAWFAGNGESFFSTRFLPTTVVHYLRPDTIRFERLAPFVRFGPAAQDRGSYPMESITPAASLTATATLLFVAALAGVVLAVRGRRWSWLALTAGGVAAAVPSFTIGFVGNRYLVDMLPALAVPAALAVACVALPPRRAWRRVGQGALGAAVLWGVWVNVGLAVWVQDLKDPGFTSWRYELDDTLFGNPAPGLVDFDPAMAVPRDGIVALAHDDAGDCTAVYIAEQGAWVALERMNGTTELRGDVVAPSDPDRGVSIAGGEGWMIGVGPADGGLQFGLFLDAAEPIMGSVIDVPDDGVLHDVRVVADPVTRELAVRVGGELALFTFAVPDTLMTPFTGFAVDPDPGNSLCVRLEARR